MKPQLAYNRNKCLSFDQCVRCLEVCMVGAISEGGDNKAQINRDICADCFLCADVCPPKALKVYGEEKTVEEVVALVEKDSAFYSRSGGGLTLSGGEPMHQPQFAISIAREARRRRIHTAMETCGYCSAEDLTAAGEHLNLLLFDIKMMDPKLHKTVTGVSNRLILNNFKAVRGAWPQLPIIVRTPIVPGVNDNHKAIRAILDFISNFDNVKYEMLPYHRLGTPKYEYIGNTYPMGEVKLDDKVMDELNDMLIEDYSHLSLTEKQPA
jgi:pyruvate formate lyase activating enzyme